jgi:hypothetical protein
MMSAKERLDLDIISLQFSKTDRQTAWNLLIQRRPQKAIEIEQLLGLKEVAV